MSNKPSIIDSLKRLERAGEEFSRSTEKLRKSAEVVADKILEIAKPLYAGKDDWGSAVGLPEGLEIHFIGDGKAPVLTFDHYTAWAPLSSRVADGRNESDPASRQDVLRFSKMIADGYLDRLAEWLEKKIAAAEKLEKSLA